MVTYLHIYIPLYMTVRCLALVCEAGSEKHPLDAYPLMIINIIDFRYYMKVI